MLKGLFKRNNGGENLSNLPEGFEVWKIKDVVQETPKAVSLIFEKPGDFQYLAGQFLTLCLEIEGEWVTREYSFNSAPYESTLSVTIKKVENGLFSSYANEKLKADATIGVKGPQGYFTNALDGTKRRTFAAFAGGSGITPIFGILKDVLENEPMSRFILVYANTDVENIIFRSKLEELSSKYEGQLEIYHFLETSSLAVESFDGRITDTKLNRLAASVLPLEEIDKYLLCGPLPMIETVKDFLKSRNVPDEKVKFELFTATVSDEPIDASKVEQNAKIEFIISDKKHEILYTDSTVTLLDAILNEGYDVPYSCQSGTCATCSCRLEEGEAQYDKFPALNDSQVKKGYILTCCSYPKSDHLVLNFDDFAF